MSVYNRQHTEDLARANAMCQRMIELGLLDNNEGAITAQLEELMGLPSAALATMDQILKGKQK
jgi:hypothetical protein